MGFKSKFKRFFELDDEVVEEEIEHFPEQENEFTAAKKKGNTQNVVSLQSIQQSSKMILVEPRAYEEAQEVADHLKSRKAVIINLQLISQDQAKRIVDFLSGTVYAIGGDIQKVGQNIFLCTPDNVDVSGAISELMYEKYNK
ncbi:cell division protein SepF [Thalassorhabdus alkalitolerans]|uniref:Cell division protein SepF n=1 Tax=Thalassorhabdus alkalitolerans TaxID=2282697 RepID=A0ABW0YP23_9BACI|nr:MULTISPECIES: cell division protein SepF [Bacillaceae]